MFHYGMKGGSFSENRDEKKRKEKDSQMGKENSCELAKARSGLLTNQTEKLK